MATLTLTGNAEQLRNALANTMASLTQTYNRSQTIIFDDTPSTGYVVKVTGADGVVRSF